MNFEDEEYVRVYSKKTITFKRLGWEGRTVLWHLMIEADRAGFVELGAGDEVEAVTVLLDLPEDIVRTGLSRLSSQGVTSRHGTTIAIDRFVEAQEAKRSERLRAQEYRDRQRSKSVTHRDESSRNETQSDGASRGVTARHDSSLPASPPLPIPLPPPASPQISDARGAGGAAAAQEPQSGVVQAAARATADPPSGVQALNPAGHPTSPEAALALPIRERCIALLENKYMAQWVRPQEWPEITGFAKFFAQASGQKPIRVGHYEGDAGLRNAVQLFADGWSIEALRNAVAAAVRSQWWQSGRGARGWSSLTAEVLRRAENEQPRQRQVDPDIAREIAKTRALTAQIGNGGT